MNFNDFFNMIVEETIESNILNTAIENSLQSYNDDLFKKKNEYIIDCQSQRMEEMPQKEMQKPFRRVSSTMWAFFS